MKHRPDDDSDDEQPELQDQDAGPRMRTIGQHSGADFEAGRVGHRNGKRPLCAADSSEDDIPLEPKKKRAAAVKPPAAAGRSKRKRNEAAAPAPAPKATGLVAFGFSGTARPPAKELPKRGATKAAATKPAATKTG